MPSINLLPWREGRRQRRKHQFLLGLGSVLIAAMLSLCVWGQVVNIQISGQKMRNEYLGTHIR